MDILNMLNAFNETKTPIKPENIETDDVTLPFLIPIIHNEVSKVAKFVDIKENMINFKTVGRIKQAISKIKNRDIDLVIDSNGGDVCAVKMICETLMMYKKKHPSNKIRAYVMYTALSGATLISLCADELYLSDYAHLGLVDPHVLDVSKYDILNLMNKKESAWDISYIIESKIINSFELIKKLLDTIIDNNTKYTSNKTIIIETLTDGKVHSAGFTIDDLEKIGIKRDGDIPERIYTFFEEQKNQIEKKADFVTKLLT